MKYQQALNRVISHIHNHLDQQITLADLSDIAAISRFHFHRVFHTLTGNTVFQFINLVRHKRAAHQLCYQPDLQVTAIAFNAGYENPESFSRAFKKITTKSPLAFRQLPDFSVFDLNFCLHHKEGNEQMNEVSIEQLENIRLIIKSHFGSPHTLPATLNQFIQWRKANALPPSKYRTFNLIYADPAITPDDDYRFDVGVATSRELALQAEGLDAITIPAGRYAKYRHFGSWQQLGKAIEFMYRHWLPNSNEQLADFPIVVERVNLYPQVPETELITDIYLPLK